MSKGARVYLVAAPEDQEKLAKAEHNIEPKMRFYRSMSVKVDREGKVYALDCYRHQTRSTRSLVPPLGDRVGSTG